MRKCNKYIKRTNKNDSVDVLLDILNSNLDLGFSQILLMPNCLFDFVFKLVAKGIWIGFLTCLFFGAILL